MTKSDIPGQMGCIVCGEESCQDPTHQDRTCYVCGHPIQPGADVPEDVDVEDWRHPECGLTTQDTYLAAVCVNEPGMAGLVARVTHRCTSHDVLARLRAAIAAFVATPEVARLAYEHSRPYGAFNWGDAMTDIPADHWPRFGIVQIEVALRTLVVNHDESFMKV